MRIHHLNCGTMCPPFGRILGQDVGLASRGKMVCHCLLCETDDGLALIDTGLGTRDVAHPLRQLGAGFIALTGPKLSRQETALAQVEALGFSARDVRHILPTHLDLDHAGGIADFPDARVHVFHLEHEAVAQRRTANEKLRYRPAQFEHRPRWEIHRLQGERWHGFESVRALQGTRDEILLVPLIGHTRGHCGVAVKTDSGWLLHAGDAYYAHSEIHARPPHCPPGLAGFQIAMQIDGKSRLHNQQRLRELKHAHGDVTIVCAHDAEELAAFA